MELENNPLRDLNNARNLNPMPDTATSECGRLIDEVNLLERENARMRDKFTRLELAVSQILAADTSEQYAEHQKIIDSAGVYLSNVASEGRRSEA